MPCTTLIILAWNQWATTQRCLESLRATSLAQTEIIVVDNGSEDETPQSLGAYKDWVRVLRLSENLGFVRGMNAGIRSADPLSDIVLLNNDLQFTQTDWLERLRDAAYADKRNGIVGCRLNDEKGNLIHNGSFIIEDTFWGQQTETGTVEQDIGQYRRTRQVQGIAFALAYIRRECIETIGLLDETFHSYFEDTDYCLRAAQAGFFTIVAGNVTLIHHQHGSTRDDDGFRERLFAASRESFRQIWFNHLKQLYRADVAWQSVTRMFEPFASATLSLVRRLDANGLRIHYRHAVNGSEELRAGNDYRLEIAAHRKLSRNSIATIMFAPLEYAVNIQGHPRILYTFSESKFIPEKYVFAINQLDELWVTDSFQESQFRNAGVCIPIQVVPLGIDPDYCHPYIRAPLHPEHRYVFLTIIDWSERNQIEQLIHAYDAAFTHVDNVELLIYIWPNEITDVDSWVTSLSRPSAHAPLRILANWGFPAYQRGQLYCAANAFVTTRYGTGWNACFVEAAACGLTVIAPDNGSMSEFVRNYGYPVTCSYSDSSSDRIQVNIEALATQMKFAYNHKQQTKHRAIKTACKVAEKYNIEDTKTTIINILDKKGLLGANRNLQLNAVSIMSNNSTLQVRKSLKKRRQIIVLGMHRSGTSALCGLLHTLGFYCGSRERLLENAEDNPKGFWERGDVHDACRLTLAARSGDWTIPFGWDENKVSAQVDIFRNAIRTILPELEAHQPWFIKEPRLCLLVEDLLPILTQPVFIHVTRNPLEIAKSLAKRNGLTQIHSLALWEEYTRRAFAASRGYPRLLFDYAEILTDPFGVTEKLFSGLHSFGIHGMQLPQKLKVYEWIEPALYRNKTVDLLETVLNAEQQSLYQAVSNQSILMEESGRSLSASSRILLETLYQVHNFAVKPNF